MEEKQKVMEEELMGEVSELMDEVNELKTKLAEAQLVTTSPNQLAEHILSQCPNADKESTMEGLNTDTIPIPKKYKPVAPSPNDKEIVHQKHYNKLFKKMLANSPLQAHDTSSKNCPKQPRKMMMDVTFTRKEHDPKLWSETVLVCEIKQNLGKLTAYKSALVRQWIESSIPFNRIKREL